MNLNISPCMAVGSWTAEAAEDQSMPQGRLMCPPPLGIAPLRLQASVWRFRGEQQKLHFFAARQSGRDRVDPSCSIDPRALLPARTLRRRRVAGSQMHAGQRRLHPDHTGVGQMLNTDGLKRDFVAPEPRAQTILRHSSRSGLAWEFCCFCAPSRTACSGPPETKQITLAAATVGVSCDDA